LFPSHFKHADVNPLKKPSLPANDPNSYGSIFNPSFISIRKSRNLSLNVYLNCNHLSNVFQSAYKQFLSTETALLIVHNDTSLNITLLDLYAAFDTIVYSVLLDLLSVWYGMSGTALTSICSFLINMFQSIKIRKCFSKAVLFLRYSPRLCSWTATVYSVYDTTKLFYSHPLIRPSDTDLPLKQRGDCLSYISG